MKHLIFTTLLFLCAFQLIAQSLDLSKQKITFPKGLNATSIASFDVSVDNKMMLVRGKNDIVIYSTEDFTEIGRVSLPPEEIKDDSDQNSESKNIIQVVYFDSTGLINIGIDNNMLQYAVSGDSIGEKNSISIAETLIARKELNQKNIEEVKSLNSKYDSYYTYYNKYKYVIKRGNFYYIKKDYSEVIQKYIKNSQGLFLVNTWDQLVNDIVITKDYFLWKEKNKGLNKNTFIRQNIHSGERTHFNQKNLPKNIATVQTDENIINYNFNSYNFSKFNLETLSNEPEVRDKPYLARYWGNTNNINQDIVVKGNPNIHLYDAYGSFSKYFMTWSKGYHFEAIKLGDKRYILDYRYKNPMFEILFWYYSYNDPKVLRIHEVDKNGKFKTIYTTRAVQKFDKYLSIIPWVDNKILLLTKEGDVVKNLPTTIEQFNHLRGTVIQSSVNVEGQQFFTLEKNDKTGRFHLLKYTLTGTEYNVKDIAQFDKEIKNFSYLKNKDFFVINEGNLVYTFNNTTFDKLLSVFSPEGVVHYYNNKYFDGDNQLLYKGYYSVDQLGKVQIDPSMNPFFIKGLYNKFLNNYEIVEEENYQFYTTSVKKNLTVKIEDEQLMIEGDQAHTHLKLLINNKKEISLDSTLQVKKLYEYPNIKIGINSLVLLCYNDQGQLLQEPIKVEYINRQQHIFSKISAVKIPMGLKEGEPQFLMVNKDSSLISLVGKYEILVLDTETFSEIYRFNPGVEEEDDKEEETSNKNGSKKEQSENETDKRLQIVNASFNIYDEIVVQLSTSQRNDIQGIYIYSLNGIITKTNTTYQGLVDSNTLYSWILKENDTYKKINKATLEVEDYSSKKIQYSYFEDYELIGDSLFALNGEQKEFIAAGLNNNYTFQKMYNNEEILPAGGIQFYHLKNKKFISSDSIKYYPISINNYYSEKENIYLKPQEIAFNEKMVISFNKDILNLAQGYLSNNNVLYEKPLTNFNKPLASVYLDENNFKIATHNGIYQVDLKEQLSTIFIDSIEDSKVVLSKDKYIGVDPSNLGKYYSYNDDTEKHLQKTKRYFFSRDYPSNLERITENQFFYTDQNIDWYGLSYRFTPNVDYFYPSFDAKPYVLHKRKKMSIFGDNVHLNKKKYTENITFVDSTYHIVSTKRAEPLINWLGFYYREGKAKKFYIETIDKDLKDKKLHMKLKVDNFKRGSSAESSSIIPWHNGKWVLFTNLTNTLKEDKNADKFIYINSFEGNVFTESLNKDKTQVFYVEEDYLYRYTDKGSEQLGNYPNILELHYYLDERFVVVLTESEVNIFRNNTSFEKLASIYVTENGLAVTDPSGLFDATQDAMSDLYFTQGKEIIELDQLKDRYYEPNLLAKVLGFSNEPLRKVGNLGVLDLYPDLQPEINKDRLAIDVINRGGGIGKISIWINGKEAILDARGDKVDADADSAYVEFNLKNHPYLIDGENKVEIKSYNKEGYLKSRGLELTFDLKKENVKPPKFYSLVVGTSNYAGTNLDLQFAAKDAKDFSNAIHDLGKTLFGDDQVENHLLTTDSKDFGKWPTKHNIDSVFNEIAQKANPEDIILLYFAGHGTNKVGGKDDFYYLTSDAHQSNFRDPEMLKRSTLSTSEITDYLKSIPALKQVLILDACHSGQFAESFLASRDQSSKSIRAFERMKDRTGLYILAGSAADAVSYESNAFNQGLLTYSLLQGMIGPGLNELNQVDVMKLFGYASEKVPELAGTIGGIQRPEMRFPKGGSPIYIGELTKGNKNAIQIATPKPVILPANFQNNSLFIDNLSLSNLFNEKLSLHTTRDTDSKFTFINTSLMQNAYQIAGRYSVEGKTITLTYVVIYNGIKISDFREIKSDDADELIDLIINDLNNEIVK